MRLVFVSIGMDISEEGIVTAVAPGGGASRAGLPVGARIVGVDGSAVDSRDQLLANLSENFDNPWAVFSLQLPAQNMPARTMNE